MENANFKPLKGRTFHKLTVESDYMKNGVHMCECICECGKKKEVRAHNLLQNGTKSCGCLHNRFGHMKLSKEERRFVFIWNKYREVMCKSWQDFDTFKSDMWDSYIESMPQYGCQYATLCCEERIMKLSNTSWKALYEIGDNRYILHNGKICGMRQWSKILGIKLSTLKARMRRMSFEEAIKLPVVQRNESKKINKNKLIGVKFGKLVVERIEGKYAVCLCECGSTTKVLIASLVHGNTKSCGCLKFAKNIG